MPRREHRQGNPLPLPKLAVMAVVIRGNSIKKCSV